MSKIHLFVTVDVRPESYDEYLAKLTDHVAIIRGEYGCESIEIFTEDGNHNQLHLWEVWSNRSTWDAHMVNANSAAFKSVISDLVIGESIKVLQSAQRTTLA